MGGTEPAARRPLRVGFYGELGHGNLGNDGSLSQMIDVVRRLEPDAHLELFGTGPAQLGAMFGLPAHPAHVWARSYQAVPRWRRWLAAWADYARDFARTLKQMRRFDVVIVPGAGVFEGEFGIRASELPYALLRLSLAGRLVGTRVALVSVGASPTNDRLSRWWYALAARLAHYRSFRDSYSKDSLLRIRAAAAADSVFTDVAFGLARPAPVAVDQDLVAVGVQIWHGGSNDAVQRELTHARYRSELGAFVRWLVESGYRVRLVIGHPQDAEVAEAMVAMTADIASAGQVEFTPAGSLIELMDQLNDVGVVVASRYHNLVCAQLLDKPTVAISYGAKSDALIEEVTAEPLSSPINELQADTLRRQFLLAREQSVTIRARLVEVNRRRGTLIAAQESELRDRVLVSRRRGGT